PLVLPFTPFKNSVAACNTLPLYNKLPAAATPFSNGVASYTILLNGSLRYPTKMVNLQGLSPLDLPTTRRKNKTP
ncbi:MAG: hypothetical protein IIT46_08540, partial [Lachnospiraceae bacterium]|nr:hypothetical protein [Lachnospiraceae bacterium]